MSIRQTAYYARVSTVEQASSSKALKQQISQLESYKCDRAYVDIQSGTTDERPEFQKLLSAIKHHEISCLYIRDMSRLARDEFVSIKFLELLKETKTKLFVAYSDRTINLHDPDDFYKVCNEGLLAARESAVLSKRVKRGMEAARKRKAANPQTPFGFTRIDEKYDWDFNLIEGISVSKIDYARETIATLLRIGTYRQTEIVLAQKYQFPCPIRLRRWIHNPVLRGLTGYGQTNGYQYIELYQTHRDKAILTDGQFNLITSRAKNNSWSGKERRYAKLFAGRCICAKCGNRMATQPIRNYVYVRCSYRLEKGDIACNQQSVEESYLWTLVSDRLVQHAQEFLDKAISLDNISIENPEITQLKIKIQQLEKINTDGFLDDKISELNSSVQSIIHQGRKPFIDTQTLKDELIAFVDPLYFQVIDEQTKKDILDLYVEKIVLNNKEIAEIIFNF